jgi:Predicted hydrolases or acyltransferases (alpha/beta hydrolase superfamily)
MDDYKHILLNHTTLTYIDQGRGAPVVLVHGSGPTDLRTWERQIEPFAAYFRVIAYSQRCHYPNPPAGDHADSASTRTHARDLAALITALQLGRAHLIGFSFGADIVLRLAVDRPDLARTLTITEPPLRSWLAALPGGIDLLAQRAAAILPAKRAVQNGDLERGARLFIDGMMGNGVFDQLPPSARQRIMDNAHLIGAEPTEISAMGTEDITRNEAATIHAPTLLLTGDESPPMFLLVSRELARYLPNVEHVQICGASHLLHVMQPQAYNAVVLEFLGTGSGVKLRTEN